MWARLSGTIELKAPGRVVISLGSVALEVQIPLSLYQELPQEGEKCTLFVMGRLRGEVFELYGFRDWETRELFGQLQGISQVGPKLALNILSVFSREELAEVVAQADHKKLAQVPGIGPRRAERLCVELKARLRTPPRAPSRRTPLFSEALSALVNLGFAASEAEGALNAVFEEGKELGDLVREALKKLSKV